MTKTLGQVARKAYGEDFARQMSLGRIEMRYSEAWEAAAQAVWQHIIREKLEALVKTFRSKERIFNQHACDTNPDGDEHWYYKVEARVWGQAADKLQKAIAVEALDKAEADDE